MLTEDISGISEITYWSNLLPTWSLIHRTPDLSRARVLGAHSKDNEHCFRNWVTFSPQNHTQLHNDFFTVWNRSFGNFLDTVASFTKKPEVILKPYISTLPPHTHTQDFFRIKLILLCWFWLNNHQGIWWQRWVMRTIQGCVSVCTCVYVWRHRRCIWNSSGLGTLVYFSLYYKSITQ